MKLLIIIAIYSVLLVSFCNLIFQSILKPWHQRGFESAVCFLYFTECCTPKTAAVCFQIQDFMFSMP